MFLETHERFGGFRLSHAHPLHPFVRAFLTYCVLHFVLEMKEDTLSKTGLIVPKIELPPQRFVGTRPKCLDWPRPFIVISHFKGHEATSHTTRLRARDHYTSSTLIGGKGGAGPSSLRTTLEGPAEYAKARWM